jgi:hypothetical protein
MQDIVLGVGGRRQSETLLLLCQADACSLGVSYLPRVKDTTITKATRLQNPRVLALSVPLDIVLMGMAPSWCGERVRCVKQE